MFPQICFFSASIQSLHSLPGAGCPKIFIEEQITFSTWCKVSNTCFCDGSTATLLVVTPALKRISAATKRFRIVPGPRTHPPEQASPDKWQGRERGGERGQSLTVRHNTEAGICISAQQPSPRRQILQTTLIIHCKVKQSNKRKCWP